MLGKGYVVLELMLKVCEIIPESLLYLTLMLM